VPVLDRAGPGPPQLGFAEVLGGKRVVTVISLVLCGRAVLILGASAASAFGALQCARHRVSFSKPSAFQRALADRAPVDAVSHLTLRWRKADSNRWYRITKAPGFPKHSGHRGLRLGHHVHGRSKVRSR